MSCTDYETLDWCFNGKLSYEWNLEWDIDLSNLGVMNAEAAVVEDALMATEEKLHTDLSHNVVQLSNSAKDGLYLKSIISSATQQIQIENQFFNPLCIATKVLLKISLKCIVL